MIVGLQGIARQPNLAEVQPGGKTNELITSLAAAVTGTNRRVEGATIVRIGSAIFGARPRSA